MIGSRIGIFLVPLFLSPETLFNYVAREQQESRAKVAVDEISKEKTVTASRRAPVHLVPLHICSINRALFISSIVVTFVSNYLLFSANAKHFVRIKTRPLMQADFAPETSLNSALVCSTRPTDSLFWNYSCKKKRPTLKPLWGSHFANSSSCVTQWVCFPQ